ncbi:PP2C family serine/threonine-protein phosphatase [Nitrosomonas communis]|uniref:PP2C family serine/threonine-protein phosphatase n=1 Tax=Nitrosomonas communis TaxID=44574 RepID=UPI0026F0E739|nr:PP2C family serine/threonine-protein phosphatase [Nitrosomonas communis]MCO6427627.1 protein phosphatase 2C domain-containing protein [Nitrosomonas communis]
MKRTFEFKFLLCGVIEEMLSPKNGAMGRLRGDVTDIEEIKKFAKKEEIIDATHDCLVKAIQPLWDEHCSKSINKRTISNSMGSLVKIEDTSKSDTQETNTVSMPEDNNTPANSDDILQKAPLTMTPNQKISFNLQNAKVGELYSAVLQIQGENNLKKVVIKKIVFPEGIGLSAEAPDFRSIIGTPLKDGEYKIFVAYHFQDTGPESPTIDSEFKLFINPDPKSLWKKLDPDPNDPYSKSNEAKYLADGTDNRMLLAASRRGRSHEHSGTFRDDDFYLVSENGWNILAVADGAGSAKSSREGSRIAVRKSVDHLKNCLQSQGTKIEQEAKLWSSGDKNAQVKTALYETFGQAAHTAVKAIEEEASSKNANSKEYSTTLLLAAHKRLPIGHFFAAFWVGDGGVGIYQKGKKVELLGKGDSGEFAGQTRFLDKQVMTGEEIMKRLNFTITEDFTSLILMTDGVTDPKFETDNNLSSLQKWDDLWNELEPLITNEATAPDELLKWLEFWSPGNHDDRTIALLY